MSCLGVGVVWICVMEAVGELSGCWSGMDLCDGGSW